MKFLWILLFLFSCINGFSCYGQWNIQSGYDFGTFTFTNPFNTDQGLNIVNRLNVVGEYELPNNISFSLNCGYDFQKIDYKKAKRYNHYNGTQSYEDIYRQDIDIQKYRLGLSFGYSIDIKDVSSVQIKLSYDQFFVNKISINQLYDVKNSYLVSSSEIDGHEPVTSTKSFSSRFFKMDRIGYKNEFLIKNRHIVLSIHYKYNFQNYFLSPSIGFSPWNKGIVLPDGRNLYVVGIRLGYTFPQKSKKDAR